jgi:hypothetical protein
MRNVWKFALALVLALGLQAGHAVQALATTLTGQIAVTNSSTSADLGFVGNYYQIFGEYGLATNSSQGLNVSFSDSSAPFSILGTNGPDATYPYLGGVAGFANTSNDLGAGSRNYAYLAGTVAGTATNQNSFSTASGVPELSQSVLWSLGAGNLLTASWVNTDSSIVAATIVYYTPDKVFLLVGDLAAFSASFGGTATPVNFTFVATTPIPAALPLFATGLGLVSFIGWRRKKLASAA